MAKTFDDLVKSRQRLDHLYVLDINNFLFNDEQLLRLYVVDETGRSFSVILFGYHQYVDIFANSEESFKHVYEMLRIQGHIDVKLIDSKKFRVVCPKNSIMEKVVRALRDMESKRLFEIYYYSNAITDFLSDTHSKNNWIHLPKCCISSTSEYLKETYACGYVNYEDIRKCDCNQLRAPKFSVMALYLDVNRRRTSSVNGCSLGITRIHRNGLASTVFTCEFETKNIERNHEYKIRFFENENLMASEVIRYIEAYDPDIIVGYDLVHILPFLKNRADTDTTDYEDTTAENENLKYKYAFSQTPLSSILGRCIVDLNILGKIFTSAGTKKSFENLCHDVLNVHPTSHNADNCEIVMNRAQLTMKLFQQTFFKLLMKASVINKIPIAKQFLREC